jgi:hypothetical protein
MIDLSDPFAEAAEWTAWLEGEVSNPNRQRGRLQRALRAATGAATPHAR